MTRSAPAPKIETDPRKLDINALATEALAYALGRGKQLAWGSGNARIGSRVVAEDVAAEAVASLFGAARGARKWNPETAPDVMQYLRSTINSLLSNQLKSSEERARPLGHSAARVADTDDPERIAIARAEEQWQQQFEDRFLEHVLEDRELLDLWTAMEKVESDKPAQLAEVLGVAVRKVDNLKKRLRSLARRIWNEMDHDVDGEKVQ